MFLTEVSFPSTGFDPSPLIDLTLKSERDRLSTSALKGFFRIMESWSVRDEDASEYEPDL